MANDVRTSEVHKFNNLLAEALKKIPEIEQPDWVEIVKTSTHNKRPNTEEDFWYKRAASILRQIYIKGIVGVSRLRTRYGGRKHRGMKPSEFRKGGGKIIRTILQQSDAAGFTEIVKAQKGTKIKPGRQITEKGKTFIEEIK